MLWCYRTFGMTSFPGVLHLLLILSPWLVFGVVAATIRGISATIKGRPYSE